MYMLVGITGTSSDEPMNSSSGDSQDNMDTSPGTQFYVGYDTITGSAPNRVPENRSCDCTLKHVLHTYKCAQIMHISQKQQNIVSYQ